MRNYRLQTMQPRRQHQEPQQDKNEIENLTTRLNNLSETATALVNVEPDTVDHEDNKQTQQETLVNTAFCLFCQKKYAKKGLCLTKHQDSCSKNPINLN
jgi:hypothetical protein